MNIQNQKQSKKSSSTKKLLKPDVTDPHVLDKETNDTDLEKSDTIKLSLKSDDLDPFSQIEFEE